MTAHVTRTRIKMCGLTRAKDAAEAVRLGADALGVVLAPSPRQVTIEEAGEVLGAAPPGIARVGVFVDADPEYVAEAVARIGLTAVQFHGSETPEQCAAAPVPVIKALRVGTEFDYVSVEPFQAQVAALLLDTYDSQQAGGTGKQFEWNLVTELSGRALVFLAGGLTPLNVAQAIAVVHPFAVDVSSGIELSPGVKGHELMHAFAAAVREADEKGRA